jgi:hypothetical protein
MAIGSICSDNAPRSMCTTPGLLYSSRHAFLGHRRFWYSAENGRSIFIHGGEGNS